MDIELAEKVYELLKADKLEEAIQIGEEKLKALPKTDFNKVIGWYQADLPDQLADFIDKYFKQAKKSIKKIEAIYGEMNGFTINHDMWYIELFFFKKFQGFEDLDWLADSDYSDQNSAIGFSDIEEVIAVFKDYMDKEKWGDPNEENAFHVAEILVILRMQEAFKVAFEKAKEKNYAWTKIPFLLTAHDYDLIYNVTGVKP